MAIIRYRERNVTPDAALHLAEINEYGLRAKAMLTALGDYWTNYYRDLDPLACATTGSMAAVSKEYTRILDLVRSSNILDVPLRQTSQFELLSISRADMETVYDANGNIDYFFVPWTDVVDTTYLTTTLFESRVVLEKGVHFDVVQQKGYKFYVDLFNDHGITGFAYEIGENNSQGLLLWACDMALSSTVIYDRYGRFLYKKTIDGEQYKWMVSALMRFYENAKSCKGIQDVLNIMYGVPYTRYKDEVITDIYYVDQNLNRVLSQIEDPYICIETDRASYYTYAFSDLLYKVGDTVPQFSLLADFNKVDDYISKPEWWKDVAFPSTLVDGAEYLSAEQKNDLMDKILKYNTVHINIGISFDTYQTYLAQVKQFFEIIESGFPVYLYPLVDTFFKAVFIDKWEIKEELEKIRATMEITTVYDWGNNLRFDGETNYYMDPDQNHGKDAECRELLFDADQNYDLPEKHSGCHYDKALHFDNPQYNTTWKKNHNNDRETLLITRVSQKVVEHYPWETSPTLALYNLTYSNMVNNDGQNFFNGLLEANRNEYFTISISVDHYADTFSMPDDAFDFTMRHKPFVDYFADRTVYNGLDNYSPPASMSKTYTEDFVPTIKVKAEEPFPWRKVELPKTATYSKVFYADGSNSFDGRYSEFAEKDDMFEMSATMQGFADNASMTDDMAISLNANFSESFSKAYDFSGTYTYGNAPLPFGGRRERFVLRKIPA